MLAESASTLREEQLPAARMDTLLLVALALFVFFLHMLTSGRYGFHPDEMAVMDDGHYLAWGYVAYPPVTPFLGRVAFELFGNSLRGVRFFPALAQSIVIVLSGLIARELGGKRLAQMTAAAAVAIAPMALIEGVLLQYVTFDYLWWVLTAYLLIRLLRTGDQRLWLAIGATVGVGMMTKYTMLFLVAGILAGLLLTDARRYLKSPWLWGGVAISLLIFLPNLLWQCHHNFVSLQFLRHIHERDVRLGRAQSFVRNQFMLCTNPLTIPLWVTGLLFYFFAKSGKRFALVGWTFVIPLILFLITQGRGYYLAPAYPMLLAAGAVVAERWIGSLSLGSLRVGIRVATFTALFAGGVVAAVLYLPVVPMTSRWFGTVLRFSSYVRDELGWRELVAEVAGVRDSLPPADRDRVAILAANYAEAGAVDIYGPTYGLPKAISAMNSYWERGYGNPPPTIVIVLGLSPDQANSYFESCLLGARTFNPVNEEGRERPYIYVCRNLRYPWPYFWEKFRAFG